MSIKADIKILIVEDMAVLRKMVRGMLSQIGFTNISEADDGATAWPMIQSAVKEGKPFEFIISDWNMPTMSGLELLKNVRADATMVKTPFLMVTAENDQENVVVAIKSGVSNYVVKPFSAQILKEKIEKIFTPK